MNFYEMKQFSFVVWQERNNCEVLIQRRNFFSFHLSAKLKLDEKLYKGFEAFRLY